jgi:hypothetical protein
MTSLGVEPAIFQHVPKCFNQLRAPRLYCDMTVEGWNLKTATDTHCEVTGRVSMVTHGPELCFQLVDPEAIPYNDDVRC